MSPLRAPEPLFEYVPGEGPLLISFPHSGTYLPPELAARLRPEALDLPDTDWFVPQLYDFVRDLGASIIRATHTRYVVDLNRPPDGAPLYPGQRETTVCPIETFGGEPLYLEGANPTPGEIDERLYSYWRPYHDKLAGLTRHLAERHGHCILWDAHSILSVVPALFAGRLLVGAGAAPTFVGTLKIAAAWFPPERFGFLAALTGTSALQFAPIHVTMRQVL